MYSLIITDYKSIDVTIEYIKKIKDRIEGDVNYIIVDNSEMNEGLNWLKKNNIEFSPLKFNSKNAYSFHLTDTEIVIVDAEENGGYAKGNNLGAKFSDFYYDNPYYIFSNNDLEIENTISMKDFENLFVNNEKIGIIGPNVISPDKSRQNPRINRGFFSQMILWDFNYLWFGCRFNKWLWNLEKNPAEGACDWISGSFMVVKRTAFNAVNGFDENTFLYCEEMIISDKLRRKKYITYYYPKIKIIHRHKGTQSRFLRRVSHDSKIYYYRTYKNVGKIPCKISDLLFELCEGVYHLWHNVIKKKGE